ncbi:hypothetical protein RUM44_000552 [Polyplax serrata]|uniref:26S proteasome non-ATPase regulatory subunit 9 n=1 Tax=Polyplax serrata TaxID=468196 RepID=A0ABR1B5R8_POLSC
MESDQPVTRESVLQLMEQKDVIEKKLQQLKQILDGNGVGMNDSLVDGDGYPRQDIDVYQVRHARHDIICLQNDHKAIMKKIEEGIHLLHSQSSQTAPGSSICLKKDNEIYYPIAKVSFVEPDSPAYLAGLQEDDFILTYGTINYKNFKSLQDIGDLTQHSIGRKIQVTVRRFGVLERLTLVPNRWQGKGLLGCNILPVEHVER